MVYPRATNGTPGRANGMPAGPALPSAGGPLNAIGKCINCYRPAAGDSLDSPCYLS